MLPAREKLPIYFCGINKQTNKQKMTPLSDSLATTLYPAKKTIRERTSPSLGTPSTVVQIPCLFR